ncbi:helicase HerA-like domain-containing protein [Aureimonas sp. AU12]|uniref:helicase HerA-like domain-containing protein n=1 Tax=Aureimonas sp. AU12 TaxID=1638161 RepID=UPI000783C984|nr:helicase HerA-like domain-containing protein [Aureimonas sp. AU12]
MLEQGKIFLGAVPAGEAGGTATGEYLDLAFANRHGLVTGATGTGKTVTLQVLAEGFSEAGVPVFCADIKGDLAGISARGEPKDFLLRRAAEVGLEPYYNDFYPTIFYDLFGEQGHPVRTTVSEMGPLLLSRLLDLTEAQEGVLNIAFKIADEDGLLLLDLKDLQAMLAHLLDNAEEISRLYGNVAKASVGAIQRQLLVLDTQGASHFFGEPALDLADIMRVDREGRGVVSVLAADRLMRAPRLYATFLLWLLSELFETLPEVGDLDKPKLVFVFDEAHLLFDDAPKALVDRVEQVVRLIRSKGVGVYFVTQNPLDLPEKVLAQLGNRVQHALRAYSPREQKAVRVAAETFRANPAFDSAEAITQLGVGEALVSVLGKDGVPTMVARTLIRPPAARLGPISPEERVETMRRSPIAGRYDTAVDRESAYELLNGRAEAELQREAEVRKAADDAKAARQSEAARRAEAAEARRTAPRVSESPGPWGRGGDEGDERDADQPAPRRAPARRPAASGYQRQTVAETVMKQVGRTVASTVTNAIVRGILGSFKRGR